MRASSREPNRTRSLVYLGFSLVVTVAIFGYLLTHVSPAEVLDLIRNADLRGVTMFLVLSLSMSVFRAWRYRVLLATAGYAPPAPALFLVVLVRNCFSDLLPARIGTLIYVYIVTTRLGVPFGAAASSFAYAFFYDFIALAPMIGAALLFAGAGAGIPVAGLVIGSVLLCAVSGAILFALPRLIDAANALLGRLPVPGPARRAAWRAALSAARDDVVRTKRAGIALRLLVLSFLVRLGKYASLYVFLFALVHPRGYGFAELPVPKVFIGLCAAELAASLPISGIAGFGAYEGTWALVFELLGYPGDFAKLTSIGHHLFTQVYGYSLGGLALLVLLLPVFRRRAPLPEQVRPPSAPLLFYGRIAAVLALIALLLGAAYRAPIGRDAASGLAPTVSVEPARAE